MSPSLGCRPPLVALEPAVGDVLSDPGLVEACGDPDQQGWVCRNVYDLTNSQTAAEIADTAAELVGEGTIGLGRTESPGSNLAIYYKTID